MAEQQRGRRAIEVGPTGRTVALNIARLRERRGLTTRQLSAVLERAGRHVPASGITRMENAQRVVTADELVALAVALGVNPSAFLFPVQVEPEDDVEVTGGGVNRAEAVWAWADGSGPLRVEGEPGSLSAGRALYEAQLQFRQGRPHWLDEREQGAPEAFDTTESSDG